MIQAKHAEFVRVIEDIENAFQLAKGRALNEIEDFLEKLVQT